MNLVEKIARMIDAEGAYAEGVNGTGPDAAKHPLSTRQKYFQAKYECQAIDILKLLGAVSKTAIRDDLIAWEKMGWKRLGLPIDRSDLKDMADEIIAKKYSGIERRKG